MNLFGIGTAEFITLFIIMLLVAGPQRMLRWSYDLGRHMRKFKKLWDDTITSIQHEGEQLELDVDMPRLPSSQVINAIHQDLASLAREVQAPSTPPTHPKHEDFGTWSG